MAELVRHRQTKGSATDRLYLNHRATPRLHTLRIVGSALVRYGVNQDLDAGVANSPTFGSQQHNFFPAVRRLLSFVAPK
jgi:hypothetical protein